MHLITEINWLQTAIYGYKYPSIISLLCRINLTICFAHALVSLPGLRFLLMVFVLSFNQTIVCLLPSKWPNMEENLISRCSSNVQTVVVLFLWSNCCKASFREVQLFGKLREPGVQRLCNQAFYWVSPVSKPPADGDEDGADSQQGGRSMTVQLLELKLPMTRRDGTGNWWEIEPASYGFSVSWACERTVRPWLLEKISKAWLRLM